MGIRMGWLVKLKGAKGCGRRRGKGRKVKGARAVPRGLQERIRELGVRPLEWYCSPLQYHGRLTINTVKNGNKTYRTMKSLLVLFTFSIPQYSRRKEHVTAKKEVPIH